MHHPRRQHNATILPDGTVLVTGGTAGSGFNGLTPGQPVHTAELWDPHTGEWTELAAEAVDRCYHSTAILLPDATVLSAGGGEFRPDKPDSVNDPKDSHRDAQIFHPPYLFRGARPDLTVAPAEVSYGQSFIAGTSHPEEIGGVSLVRLSSVTHSCNMDQRINFLGFRTAAGGVSITVPEGPDLCPPGHYMLFLLSRDRVPSVAKILRIAAPAAPRRLAAVRAAAPEIPEELVLSTAALDDAVRSEASGTHAVIGLTSRCPYGLGACWGGAYEALQQLDGVQSVRPIANAEHSTADVYLRGNMLPDVDRWAAQITSVANGSYDFRGIEVSLQAVLREEDGELRLHGPAIGETVTLAPLEGVAKVQFDRATLAARPATAEEIGAYRALAAKYRDAGSADFPVRVTGPLKNADSGRILYVRAFEN
jgi:hypothetical protein